MQSSGQGYAGASGEHTHTDVRRTAGGGVIAVSFASSTGQRPQQHETSVLRTETDPTTMRTHDLKLWLQQRGADIRGVVERSELERMARDMAGEPGAAGGTAGGHTGGAGS